MHLSKTLAFSSGSTKVVATISLSFSLTFNDPWQSGCSIDELISHPPLSLHCDLRILIFLGGSTLWLESFWDPATSAGLFLFCIILPYYMSSQSSVDYQTQSN